MLFIQEHNSSLLIWVRVPQELIARSSRVKDAIITASQAKVYRQTTIYQKAEAQESVQAESRVVLRKFWHMKVQCLSWTCLRKHLMWCWWEAILLHFMTPLPTITNNNRVQLGPREVTPYHHIHISAKIRLLLVNWIKKEIRVINVI